MAALALFGLWSYAFWGGEVSDKNSSASISQAAASQFTEGMRAKVIATMGQPIEGFQPFMFMQAFPGLTANDFNNVDALIGRYVYQDGEVVYDLNGEQELHSAARAVSDEGMVQLLVNVANRLNFDLSGGDTVDDVIRALSTAPGADPTQGQGSGTSDPNGSVSSPAGGTVPAQGDRPDGPMTTKTGVITCLPHKGDGPHTMECAFGLKADDGKHYGLRYLWEVAPGMTETNVRVSISGVFSPAPSDEKYDIAGYIDVRSANEL